MNRLDELYTELHQAVYTDDMNSQMYYLQTVAEHRKIDAMYLVELGAMFIPNNDYISHYLGSKVFNYNTGLYYKETCPWTLFLILPIRNLVGEVVGIVGWDAYNKYLEVAEGKSGLTSYKVSSKSVFDRDKYFLSDIDCLKDNFSKSVLFVTDGVFDCVTLNYRKIPTIGLLGSTFSKEVLYFLRWYKRIYVCADNDKAGLALAAKMSRVLPNVHRVIQNKTKDIEELLRGDGKDGPLTKQLLELRDNNNYLGDFILKC